MSYFFPYPLLALLLALPPQQEATPPAPSVADAARAARERQKTATAKHVLTDDDVAHSGAGTLPPGADEAQVRADLEKEMPKNPLPSQLQLAVAQIGAVAKLSPADIIDRSKRMAVGFNLNADFPGKKEWDSQMETAITRMVEEAGKAASRLQPLQSQYQEAFSARNAEALQKLRTEWIDAELPYVAWQKRYFQLSADGLERAKAATSKAQPQ